MTPSNSPDEICSMRDSSALIERGVNAWEMSPFSLVWRDGSVKISHSGPYRELKQSWSESALYTPS
jgi:hypothetical protein